MEESLSDYYQSLASFANSLSGRCPLCMTPNAPNRVVDKAWVDIIVIIVRRIAKRVRCKARCP
jgi:hypothetical protein